MIHRRHKLDCSSCCCCSWSCYCLPGCHSIRSGLGDGKKLFFKVIYRFWGRFWCKFNQFCWRRLQECAASTEEPQWLLRVKELFWSLITIIGVGCGLGELLGEGSEIFKFCILKGTILKLLFFLLVWALEFLLSLIVT